MTREEIENKLKETIVTALDLEDLTAADIETEVPLFGEGLGLDSIDALELGMAIKKAFGVTFSSNSLVIGRDDYASGAFSPRNGLVIEKLENCTIMGNTAHAAFLEKFIVDRGGHTNLVCRDNMATPMKDVSEVFVVVPEK